MQGRLQQNLDFYTVELAYAALKRQRMHLDVHDCWPSDEMRKAYIEAEEDMRTAFAQGKLEMEIIRGGKEKPWNAKERN